MEESTKKSWTVIGDCKRLGLNKTIMWWTIALHSGYSYYRGGGGIPIGAYLPSNMEIKIFL